MQWYLKDHFVAGSYTLQFADDFTYTDPVSSVPSMF